MNYTNYDKGSNAQHQGSERVKNFKFDFFDVMFLGFQLLSRFLALLQVSCFSLGFQLLSRLLAPLQVSCSSLGFQLLSRFLVPLQVSSSSLGFLLLSRFLASLQVSSSSLGFLLLSSFLASLQVSSSSLGFQLLSRFLAPLQVSCSSLGFQLLSKNCTKNKIYSRVCSSVSVIGSQVFLGFKTCYLLFCKFISSYKLSSDIQPVTRGSDGVSSCT